MVTKTPESGRPHDTGKPATTIATELMTSVKTAEPAKGKPVAEEAGRGSSEPLDDNTVRTSFSKTLRGRVVSIDVFCTKV